MRVIVNGTCLAYADYPSYEEETMQIKQLLPATDWFWIGTAIDEKPIVQHVAAWAVVETNDGDQVIGMIGLAVTNAVNPETPRLVSPSPRVPGNYAHRDELTPAEAAAI